MRYDDPGITFDYEKRTITPSSLYVYNEGVEGLPIQLIYEPYPVNLLIFFSLTQYPRLRSTFSFFVGTLFIHIIQARKGCWICGGVRKVLYRANALQRMPSLPAARVGKERDSRSLQRRQQKRQCHPQSNHGVAQREEGEGARANPQI